MAETGRPNDSTPLSADDIVGSLASQVRELSLRVADLEGQLEAARKRVAVYEGFDAQVQDSLSAALRAASQIRERARVTAEAITEEARARRPSDTQELDAMRIERDALRRAIETASTVAPSRASAPAVTQVFPMSEMRTAATEALRGVFKELVAEIRSLPPAAAVPQPAAAPVRPDSSPSPFVAPTVSPMPAAQRPAAPVPPPAPAAQPVAATAPSAPPVQSWDRAAPVSPEPYSAPPSGYNAPAAQQGYPPPPAPRPVVVPPSQPPATVEDIEVAPAAAARAPSPVPGPAAVPTADAPLSPPRAVPQPTREEWVAPSEPIGEVQVVLSPISSFPRLVELERRLQGMPAVRTVYARDFRNGVATLAIGLRNPMTVDEFAAAVTRLEYPRLRVVSTSGYILELRIDSEASSIA